MANLKGVNTQVRTKNSDSIGYSHHRLILSYSQKIPSYGIEVLEWLTSSVDNSTKFWPRDGYVFENILYVIGDVHSNNRNINEANLVLQGPFTKDDPRGERAAKVKADIKYPEFAG